MQLSAEANPEYLRLLVRYYEEEISGAIYFDALARNSSDPDCRGKLALLATVERRAAETMLPLLLRYGLRPRDDVALRSEGESSAARHLGLDWPTFVDHVVTTYPRYMDEFEALERMAPASDLPALKRLSRHETLTIDFAEREQKGDSNSVDSLRAYLDEGTV